MSFESSFERTVRNAALETYKEASQGDTDSSNRKLAEAFVMNSDVIMVLDHGKIIERGSHDQLIAEKGTYYQLYTGAFELE